MRLSLYYVSAFALIAMLMSSACNRSDTAGPASRWSIENDTYTAFNVRVDTTAGFALTANNGGLLNAGNTVTFQFPQKPTTDGSIAIGDDSTALKLTAIVVNSSGKHYYYRNTMSSATRATYTVRDGKVMLDIPSLTILESYDTVSFSAHVVEP